MEVIKKESFKIDMPKRINIGDPMYFEEYGKDFQYVYSKAFRGRGEWVGELVITEEKNVSEFDGRDFVTVRFFVAFAPSEELLKTYIEGKYYKHQRVSSTEIGVDTACYLLELDSNYIKIDTGSDGTMGEVNEFYNKSKLEGITIDLTGLDVNEFERFRDDLKYVFNA